MATASYVYVAEISQADQRGILSATGPVHVSLGVLSVYILGFIVPWQRVAALCTLCALLSFITMCAVPESPPWLASHGRHKEALSALVWLRKNPVTAESELSELMETVAIDRNSRLLIPMSSNRYNTMAIKRVLKPFLQSTAWKPFIILLLFFAFQESSGIYIILYYAVNLFQEVSTGLNEYVASIVVAGVRLLMSVVGAILMNSFGRKTLAVVSGLGMAIFMVAGGSYEYLYSHLPSTDRPLPWVPLICVLGHVCVSMMGFLQLPWMMNGELFPLAIRGVMGGIVASLAHMLIFGSVKTYPDLMHGLGTDGTLWLFGAAALLGALYCYIFLPETKGKTLREIELTFSPKERSSNEENTRTRYTVTSEFSRCNKNEFNQLESGENVRTPNNHVSGEVSQVFTVEAQCAVLKWTR